VLVNSVTVFCGAQSGRADTYVRAAGELGRAIARANLRLVYGGAAFGLMGVLANAALSAGGTVIGVIPQNLGGREVAHSGLTELHVIPDLHRRKALMAELGDAFVALPGGLGTVEEFFEALSWSHLRLHSKPCVLLDIQGYYRSLLAFIDHSVHEGFFVPDAAQRIITCQRVDQVVEALGHADTLDEIDAAGA